MKYVMLRSADGMLFVVMGLGIRAKHSAMAAAFPGHAIVGAGFVKFTSDGQAETYGHSESLNRSPDPADARWITNFYRAGLPAPHREFRTFQPSVLTPPAA